MEMPAAPPHPLASAAAMSRRRRRAAVVLGVGALVLTLGALPPVGIVPPGHRGVMVTLGEPSDKVYGEGAHWHWPLLQSLHVMDVRIASSDSQGTAASRDLQSVTIKVVSSYHVEPGSVARVFRDIATSSEEAAEKIVRPARPEAVKAVTARYTAEELITRRTEVRDQIASLLREKMARHGFALDEFSIVNFEFSPAFSAAIEAKVKAEQDKLTADRDLERIRVEAQQRVTSARAEAEALRVQREQVTPLLLELRRVEAQRAAVAKWDGKLPSTLAGGAAPLLPLPATR